MLSAATAEEVKTTTSTTKSESQTMVPHEYIRDTLTFRYGECKSCGTRTEFTCIRCGYCYSWKKEELQKQFNNNNKPETFSPLLKSGRKNGLTEEEKQKEEQLQGQKQQQQQHQQRIVNIFGQVSEPICAYYRYHHKFSLHGSSRCRCRHATNRTLISMKHVSSKEILGQTMRRQNVRRI
jgi:hypothetical protein